jgi:RNA-binding protein
MKLSEAQKKHLRGLGHQLKPVIIVGDAGLTDSVMNEFLGSIHHHELVKVRVRAGNRHLRDDIIRQMCEKADASLVTRIGNIALIYKQNPEKSRIQLPRARHS